jgi:hypothetical protein
VPLADDAYWLVTNAWTGRSRTAARAAGLVVGAALLGELIAAGLIATSAGTVYPTRTSPPFDDALGREVFAQITGEAQAHSLADWLEFLTPDSCDRVGRRMVDMGAARTESIGTFRRRTLYHPTDPQRAGWVHAGLGAALRDGHQLEQPQLFLLRLATAGSLRHQIFAEAEADQHQIDAALQQLGLVWPPWIELLDAADYAIAATALTR